MHLPNDVDFICAEHKECLCVFPSRLTFLISASIQKHLFI